jgi:hypothetical protein
VTLIFFRILVMTKAVYINFISNMPILFREGIELLSIPILGLQEAMPARRINMRQICALPAANTTTDKNDVVMDKPS